MEGNQARAPWEFDDMLNSRHEEIQKQKVSTTLTSLQYLLKFAPTLDNLKSCQWTRNSGIL